ncbi:MAG: hypothetical protein QOF71_2041 [Candidatus Eremiobacteraeota bacterium]|jgi:hypothetical protein|nr:hypothetical protein [Candidatus Eremiobacteraeota bacterium]
MLPLLLAYAIAAAPTPCPSDLLVANPRLRVVRAADKAYDNYVVTIDVTNRGTAPQPNFTSQHLALVRDRVVIGTQPIPPLAANASYAAAFRVQLVHERNRAPFVVEFRYELESKNAARANCTSANDRLTATL